MKSWLLLFLLLIPIVSWAGLPMYYREVSATQTNTTVTFTLIPSDNKVFAVTLKNDGSNEVFFNSNGPTATTSSAKLLAGESIVLRSRSAITVMGLICSAGETTTVRVFGFPSQ